MGDLIISCYMLNGIKKKCVESWSKYTISWARKVDHFDAIQYLQKWSKFWDLRLDKV